MTVVEADARLVGRALVEVRGSRWIVSGVTPGGSTPVDPQTVGDGHCDRTLRVIRATGPRARAVLRASKRLPSDRATGPIRGK